MSRTRPVEPEGTVSVPVPKPAALVVVTTPAWTEMPPVKVLAALRLSVLAPILVSRPEPETTPVVVRSKPLVLTTVAAFRLMLLPMAAAAPCEMSVPPAMTTSRVRV